MTTKKSTFKMFSTILVIALFFVAFTLFARGTFAQDEGFVLESGTVTCDHVPAGCMSFGCNGNPPNYSCSLSAQQNGATCTSGGSCSVH